jgi:predicted TIM-barrel fold metal-dependent hydrolase
VVIDVHAHCYPKPYVEELRKSGRGTEGGIGTEIPVWVDDDERISLLDELGIDVQVLSLSAPNVYFEDPDLSMALAQTTNDFLAEICRRHPERFLCLASVPLTNMKYAIDELHRAVNGLGMDGVVLGTNVNQRSLSEDRFLPFFEEVNRINVPIALHPLRAIGEDLMPEEDRKLAIPPNVGFIFETTRTMAQMTFKGTFEKYRNLTFILPHAGGAIPFIYPRWDMGYRVRPDSHALKKLPSTPSYYLKRHYYDTAQTFHPFVLKCTVELATIDHLLFGTDCPYTSLDIRAKETIENIQNCGFSVEETEKIDFRNALKLFPKLKEPR